MQWGSLGAQGRTSLHGCKQTSASSPAHALRIPNLGLLLLARSASLLQTVRGVVWAHTRVLPLAYYSATTHFLDMHGVGCYVCHLIGLNALQSTHPLLHAALLCILCPLHRHAKFGPWVLPCPLTRLNASMQAHTAARCTFPVFFTSTSPPLLCIAAGTYFDAGMRDGMSPMFQGLAQLKLDGKCPASLGCFVVGRTGKGVKGVDSLGRYAWCMKSKQDGIMSRIGGRAGKICCGGYGAQRPQHRLKLLLGTLCRPKDCRGLRTNIHMESYVQSVGCLCV